MKPFIVVVALKCGVASLLCAVVQLPCFCSCAMKHFMVSSLLPYPPSLPSLLPLCPLHFLSLHTHTYRVQLPEEQGDSSSAPPTQPHCAEGVHGQARGPRPLRGADVPPDPLFKVSTEVTEQLRLEHFVHEGEARIDALLLMSMINGAEEVGAA